MAAACGVAVAKHGNRSVSSRCGSADVLEALGVPLELEPEKLGALLDAEGFAFLFAPRLHPAMRAVMPVRRVLGVRTVFNLLGPLANPAGVRRQVVGVYNAAVMALVAGALAELGAEHAWVVHGEDGLDELSVCAPTRVIEVRAGKIAGELVVDPAKLGIARATRADLAGGDAAENAVRSAGNPRRTGALACCGRGRTQRRRCARRGGGFGGAGFRAGGKPRVHGRRRARGQARRSDSQGAGAGRMTAAEPDILAKITGAVRERLAQHPPSADLEPRARETAAERVGAGGRSLHAALMQPGVRVIAECKRRSPSKGSLREPFEPVELARAYEAGGAAAVSVVTEPEFFAGDTGWIPLLRREVLLPVMQKDFLLSPRQIFEAALLGADAVLLIARILPGSLLSEMLALAGELGLEALIEVHDEDDLEQQRRLCPNSGRRLRRNPQHQRPGTQKYFSRIR